MEVGFGFGLKCTVAEVVSTWHPNGRDVELATAT
jgi:hypothetical protein